MSRKLIGGAFVGNDLAAIHAVDTLRDLGLRVEIIAPHEVAVFDKAVSTKATIKVRRAETYRWDITKLLNSVPDDILLVVPRASRAAIDHAMRDNRLHVIATDTGEIVWRGNHIPARSSDQPQATERGGRTPWGRWAVMRALALSAAPSTQTQLARLAGITQPAVSQALGQLGDSVRRTDSGWVASDRSAMWDAFLDDYTGPGGITTHWFGLAAPIAQTNEALKCAHDEPVSVLRSGDSAADELAPWRTPEKAVVYAERGLPLDRGSLAQSPPERATLEVVVPADRTIWATARPWAEHGTVDPLIAAWDVARAGGRAADEAAAALKRWALAPAEESPS